MQGPVLYNEEGAQLISVQEASQLSNLTTSFIRRLLRDKRIAGVKHGRDWFTTKEAIQDYLQSERQVGRPRNP